MDMQPEKVFKSGPLFISSKGLGWKSWKKRWFILTRTSLVFFRNDPSALPQRGGEVNLTLGGIGLNNSGSVVIREDKKLLTVLFPDGRDGRAFTLKAESSEELYEWKTALEDALAQAPSASLVMRHNGIFRSDTNYAAEGSFHQWRDKRTVKSLVVGQPIWLALEDIDGGPSFLEKALQFVEAYGTKVEGILRQSADVEEVERRVQEYEEGKNEFGYDEDAHIVGDCIKYVLREFPSSPVPASCCTALLEAYRGVDGKEARAIAMRSVIFETFPELNRRLLQRILKMMHTVSSHASDNLMTPWAVAACMAPLLLRPLVDGECQFEEDFDMGTDNSQLLAAANAANNAQAIITTLLEEYENVFDDDIANRCSISADSRTENSDSEDSADVGKFHIENKSCHDAQSESSFRVSDLYDFKVFGCDDMDAESPRSNLTLAVNSDVLINPQQLRDYNTQFTKQLAKQEHESEISVNVMETINSGESINSVRSATHPGTTTPMFGPESCAEVPVSKPTVSPLVAKRPTVWKRSNGRRGLSMESVDSSGEEELSIQRLEIMKNDLQQRIATEARGNAILQATLEKRKQALHERRLALEQDVARLQEQLQAERDLKAALEVGLSMSSEQFASSWGIDSKTKAELEEIALAEIDVAKLKQKVAELHNQLNQQRHSHVDSCERHQHIQNQDSNESFLGSYWRGLKEQVLASASIGRQNARKQLFNLGLGESKSTKARNLFMDELCPVDSLSSRSSGASAALAELTTRLNFFKERRSQLMEQLHSLDLSFGTVSSQEFAFKPSSPPWN